MARDIVMETYKDLARHRHISARRLRRFVELCQLEMEIAALGPPKESRECPQCGRIKYMAKTTPHRRDSCASYRAEIDAVTTNAASYA